MCCKMSKPFTENRFCSHMKQSETDIIKTSLNCMLKNNANITFKCKSHENGNESETSMENCQQTYPVLSRLNTKGIQCLDSSCDPRVVQQAEAKAVP